MKVRVMVSGLPGRMATLVAEAILEDERMELVGHSLTGEEITDKDVVIRDRKITLIKPSERKLFTQLFENGFTDSDTDDLPNLVVVDFTSPKAVNENVKLYTRYGFDFVVGTTGGDIEEMQKDIENSWAIAVVAPNMSVPIVILQDMWRYAAQNFPGMLKGFYFSGWESHQFGKKDKSGTMKSFLPLFRSLGINASEENIESVRSPDDQLKAGIPEEFLGAHGWHDYSFVSLEDQIEIQFGHDINGRSTYVHGVMEAIMFVYEESDSVGVLSRRGKMLSMIDVIRKK